MDKAHFVRAFMAVTAIGAFSDTEAATLAPAEILPSALTIRIEPAGNIGISGGSTNIAEPIAIGDDLYVIDKGARNISISRSGGPVTVLDEASLPEGVTPVSRAAIINMAGTEERVVIGFHSSTLPSGFDTPAALPSDPNYRIDDPRYDLLYSYDRAPDGTLSNPSPITAFDTTINGHRGEGMLILPDGRLLYARGDNLNQNFDGLEAPQSDSATPGKLLIIDPDTGNVEVAAKGLRNVQRMTYADAGRTRILFSEIGWTVSEEINEVSVADLTDTSEIENFGWGRNPDDGLAREGGFYVSEGPESSAMALGVALVGEAGFIQPFAEFGREDRTGFFAVSGPVVSDVSFTDIGVLFGDLVSGTLFATLDGDAGSFNDVFSVALVDIGDLVTDLQSMLGVSRVDLRLFNFTDGGAGLLSERTGDIFRLSEISVPSMPVPIPASLPMFGLVLAATALSRRIRMWRRAQV